MASLINPFLHWRCHLANFPHKAVEQLLVMPRHDTNAMPRSHEQRFGWSKQVELAVGPTTAWQPDRLAQRDLFDEKTRPHVPGYDSISLVAQNGILYDYYPAKKYHLDCMLGPKVPAEMRARLWLSVMTIPDYAGCLRNLCHEAAADYPAMEELLLRGETGRRAVNTTLPSWHKHRWAVLLPVHNLCTLLGLANSYDTTVVVEQSVLEEHEEALKNNLRRLWEQKYVIANRKNKPDAEDQQPMIKLGSNIGQVFRKFSGYELKSTQDGPQPRKSISNPEGGKMRHTWQLKLCPKLPLIPEIIRAVTLQTELPETVSVNLTEAQDAAAEDSDSEIEIEIDYEETDCEEQTSCRNKFNKRRISSRAYYSSIDANN